MLFMNKPQGITKDLRLIKESLKFGVVGILATTTHYGVAYSSLVYFDPFLANTVGYAFAVVVSYVGHNFYTFRYQKHMLPHKKKLIRFLTVSLSSLGLSHLTLGIATMFGLLDVISLALGVIIVPPYTFILSRLWVFKSTSEGQEPSAL